MARLVAIGGVTHNPLFWRAFQGNDDDSMINRVRGRFEDLRDHLSDAAPDVAIVVGTDHLTQWSTDVMPAFMIGQAPRFDGTFHNEEREFGIPTFSYSNHRGVARGTLDGTLSRGFDLAFSDEFRVDHAFTLPHAWLAPEPDLPMVPLWTNCIAPPFPRPARFVDLGVALRRSIEDLPDDLRVAVIVSGHLAVEVGGPKQFRGSPDPDFDQTATDWIDRADVAAAVEGSTFERLLEAGNVTHQFLNFLVAMGLADGRRPAVADALPSRYATAPFFLWE